MGAGAVHRHCGSALWWQACVPAALRWAADLCGLLCGADGVCSCCKSSWLTEAFSAVLSGLCLFTPFEDFVNNSFSIPTLVYYLTVTAVFSCSSPQGLEKRRWN